MKNEIKNTILFTVSLLILIIPSASKGIDLPNFRIMTEDWVPYQFEKDGKMIGVAVDLLVLLLERTGSQQGRKDIKMYPWARGYRLLQTQENTILFSTTKTEERENLFKWVGPIFQNYTYLIAKKSKGINISSVKQLQKYKIGTIIDDASELFMKRLGLTLDQLERNINSIDNIKKLNIDRIDFVVSGWAAFENDARSLGVDPDLYETVFEVDSSDVFYAFNRKTPAWIIEKFQSELDKIKHSGQLDAIMKKYVHLIN
jgi:polar amino acid transport system substrate-binding protein